MDLQEIKGEKIIADYLILLDIIGIIIPSILVGVTIMFLDGFFFSHTYLTSIIGFSIIFIGYAIYLLQSHTVVNFTGDTVIIHKPLRKPIIINKEEIKNTEIKKNESYTFRWIFRIIFIVLLIYMVINTINEIHLCEQQSYPFIEMLFSIVSINLAFILVLILIIGSEIRSPYPTALKLVMGSHRYIILCVDDPDKYINKLQ
ncbi:MAG: hypothetical protein K8R25_03565 [Methanosarcinales archaeon]|nr:hypothetical protein [Methanosarcinales archaeon]